MVHIEPVRTFNTLGTLWYVDCCLVVPKTFMVNDEREDDSQRSNYTAPSPAPAYIHDHNLEVILTC